MEGVNEDGDIHVCGNCHQTFGRLDLWLEHKQMQWCKTTAHTTPSSQPALLTSPILPTHTDSQTRHHLNSSMGAEVKMEPGVELPQSVPIQNYTFPINPRKRDRTRSRKQESPQSLSKLSERDDDDEGRRSSREDQGRQSVRDESRPLSEGRRMSTDSDEVMDIINVDQVSPLKRVKSESETSVITSTAAIRKEGTFSLQPQSMTPAEIVSPSPTSDSTIPVLTPTSEHPISIISTAVVSEAPSCRRPYVLPRVYSCPRCSKNFIKLSHLHRHMNKKKPCELKDGDSNDDNSDDDGTVSLPNQIVFTCGLCSEPFISYEAVLSHHSERHPAYYPGYCRFCGKFKDRKNKLLIHLVKHDHSSIVDQVSIEVKRIRHTKIDKQTAQLSQASTSASLSNSVNTSLSETSCPTCKSKFNDRDELVCHFNDYHTPVGVNVTDSDIFDLLDDKSSDVLKCFICCLKFVRKIDFEQHIDTHLVWSDKIQPILKQKDSAVSQQQARQADQLNNNTEDVMDLSMKPRSSNETLHSSASSDTATPEAVIGSAFSCWICSSQAHDLFSWRRHVIEQHQIPLVYRCVVEDCRNEYRTWNELYEHRTEHLQRSYVCQVCNDHQPTRSLLANHTQAHHYLINSTPTVCVYCQSLIMENIEFHKTSCSQQLVSCSECSDKVKRMSLPKHMLTHSTAAQTMNYICDQCNSAFPIRERLTQHMRNVHGPRKYVCADCGAAFKRNDKLQRHSQSCHSDVKPFVCPIVVCGRAFKRVDGLRAHVKCSHISEALVNSLTRHYSCTVCGCIVSSGDRLIDHLMSHVREAPATDSPSLSVDIYSPPGTSTDTPGNSPMELLPRLLQCPQCPVKLPSEHMMYAHLLQHATPNSLLHHASLPLPLFMLPQLGGQPNITPNTQANK